MRKTICNRCGKYIQQGTTCECKKQARREYEKTYERDPLLNSYRWRKKREHIKKRDDYMCQRCLIKFKQVTVDDLEVHHIKSRKDYPELAWEDDNLICVCQTCNLQLSTRNKLDFEWNKEVRDYVL